MIKKITLLILFSSFMFYTPFLLSQALCGYNLGKLEIKIPYDPNRSFHIEPESMKSVRDVFIQKFSYLARGNQSFAFISEDGKFILKIFRNGGWIHPWRKFIRSKLFSPNRKRFGIQNLLRQLAATKVAFEQAPDLTGLIYVHLNLTDSLLPKVCCKDPIGRSFQLDLDKHLFSIQLRATPFEEAYSIAIKSNDREKFKRLTRSFISLLKSRISRGIRNTDAKLIDNFGFIGEQAIEWDFGCYTLEESINQANELSIFTTKAAQFFQANYPEWVDEYDAIIQN